MLLYRSKYLLMLTPWSKVLLEKLTGLQLVKKFLAFLWNPKVQYCLHKCLPPVSILSQLSPVHILTSNYLKIRLNIILPSTPGSTKRSLSLRVSDQTTIHDPSLPIRATCPTHLISI
jgi:hypothetical protein